MNFIDSMKLKAKENKKRIVLPESMDERILKASEIIINEDIAYITLIGDKEEIVKKYPILEKAEFINPKLSDLTESYTEKLYELRKNKGMTKEQALELLLNDNMYFSCMLLLDRKVDGIVSGCCHTSKDTLKPALEIIKTKPNTNLASSFFIMDIPNYNDNNGIFIFSDCGLNKNPNSNELAEIAISSGDSYKLLIGKEPYIAMLSHSTKGSSNSLDVDKVIEATKLAKKLKPEYKIDGEIQLDAAISKEVAKIKDPNGILEGQSNVLIFPNLDSGNIGYKLVERFAHAKAYGPLTQGMKYPVNDLSRGCSVEDIVGVVSITAIQANNIE